MPSFDDFCEQDSPVDAPAAKPSPRIHPVIRGVSYIALGLFLGFLLRTFVIGSYVIPSGSMLPTLGIEDRIIGSKLAYASSEPERGDIVVFFSPEDGETRLIKRVVATAGQTVSFDGGRLVVDGVVQSEPFAEGESEELSSHASTLDGPIEFPYTVPDGCVFVMGDNRMNSADSRYFGAVPLSSIEAEAWFRYYPLDQVGAIG